MSVERKRIFVGGLNSGTNEHDIRERFKMFGSVSSVEIHKRAKSEGFPEKTFAYVDIDALDSSVRKCITMLSNTKWKGGILKIQLAKENFLTRLKKEREEMNSKKAKSDAKITKCSSMPTELTYPVPSAIPGTLIPGKKNWVVGKFGRVLPVIHMRQKDGRKICKMDPSKTLHSLKKIKDDHSNEKPVSELTWSFGTESDDDDNKRGDINGNRHSDDSDDTDSSSSDDPSDEMVLSHSNIKNGNPLRNKVENEQMESFEYKSRKRGTSSKKCVAKELDSEENGLVNQEAEVNDNHVIQDDSTDDDIETVAPIKVKKKCRKQENSSKKCVAKELDSEENGLVNQEAEVNDNDDDIQDDCSDYDIETVDLVNAKDKSRKQENSSKKCAAKELSSEENGLENQEAEVNDNHVFQDDSTDDDVETVAPVKVKQKSKNRKKRKGSCSSDSDPIDSIPDGSLDEASVKKKRKCKKKKSSFSEENDLKLEEDDEEIDLQICSLDLKSKSDDLDGSLKDEKKGNKKERKRDMKLKDGLISENKDIKKRKSKNEQVSEEVKVIETIDKDKNKQKKKSPKILNGNTSKKLASNEKRLQAIKEREVRSTSKQSIIASALYNLDTNDGRMNNSKHIKFDEEYDGGEQVTEKRQEKTTEKISGSKASNWLGLESASDDDDEPNGNKQVEDHIFAAKPQFEGETGHKLFKLQKSFRGDSRFQLDKRFAEGDSDSEVEDESTTRKHAGIDTTRSSDSDVEATDEDDMSKKLSKEKDISMSVLRGIMGHNIQTKYDHKSATKGRFSDSVAIRYDPTREDHAQFEQIPKKKDSPEPAVDESQQKDVDVIPTESAPEVTSQKYYDVKTNALTEMFGKGKSGDNTTLFTFLSDQDVTEDKEAVGSGWEGTEELRSKPWNPVMLPYDSSADEQEDMDNDEQETYVHRAPDEERFFFHFGDPELETRLEEDSLFMRTHTLEELNEHWIATRSELTQDYKKKHKDALRRQSKMVAKRARMR